RPGPGHLLEVVLLLRLRERRRGEGRQAEHGRRGEQQARAHGRHLWGVRVRSDWSLPSKAAQTKEKATPLPPRGCPPTPCAGSRTATAPRAGRGRDAPAPLSPAAPRTRTPRTPRSAAPPGRAGGRRSAAPGRGGGRPAGRCAGGCARPARIAAPPRPPAPG